MRIKATRKQYKKWNKLFCCAFQALLKKPSRGQHQTQEQEWTQVLYSVVGISNTQHNAECFLILIYLFDKQNIISDKGCANLRSPCAFLGVRIAKFHTTQYSPSFTSFPCGAGGQLYVYFTLWFQKLSVHWSQSLPIYISYCSLC